MMNKKDISLNNFFPLKKPASSTQSLSDKAFLARLEKQGYPPAKIPAEKLDRIRLWRRQVRFFLIFFIEKGPAQHSS